MKTQNSLKKSIRITAVSALLAALLPMSSALALPAMPTSGTCAMLITQPVPYGSNIPAGATGYNDTALLTFQSSTWGTLEFYGMNVTYTSIGISVQPPTATTIGNPVQFSLSPSTVISGVTVLSVIPPGSTSAITMNLTPVNGGKTILVQGTNIPFSGVCQF